MQFFNSTLALSEVQIFAMHVSECHAMCLNAHVRTMSLGTAALLPVTIYFYCLYRINWKSYKKPQLITLRSVNKVDACAASDSIDTTLCLRVP